MLLIKVRNALELLWDSLDSEERRMLAYAVGYLVVTLVVAYQRSSRDRLVRELREELRGEALTRN